MRWRDQTQSIPLGTYDSALFRRRLQLAGQDAKSRMHVMGKSGSGKSRWLAGFYVNLLKAGFSATLIDPHGDLARLVLAQLVSDGYFEQEDAYQRLLYLDVPSAAKTNRYLNFNCLQQPYDTHTTTRLTLEAMRRAFPELDRNAGNAVPAFEQIITADAQLLVENGLPFSELRDVLLNQRRREQLLRQMADPLVHAYCHGEFDAYDKRERLQLLGSTLRRLFLLLYAPVVRFALSAEQGAKSRADLTATDRAGVLYVIVDEYQLLLSNSSRTVAASHRNGLIASSSETRSPSVSKDFAVNSAVFVRIVQGDHAERSAWTERSRHWRDGFIRSTDATSGRQTASVIATYAAPYHR